MPQARPDAFSLIYSKTLETFFAVCQQRSFTKAAESLGLSQSAVSQSVLRLEEHLGVTLFERNVRPVGLTPEARLLKEQIETHSAEIAGTIGRIREANALKPIVRAAVVESLSPNIAPSLVRALAQQANRVSILTGTSDVIVHGLLNHQVDVIVSSDPFHHIDGLSRYFLFREPHVLVLPPSMGSASAEWQWSDLQYCGLPVVRYASHSASGRTVESFFRSMRLDLPVRFEADTSRVIFSLVSAGVGWTLTTPLCLLQCADMVPRMRVVRAPQPTFSREIHVITRKGDSDNLAREVLRICAKELRESIAAELVGIASWVGPDLQVAEAEAFGKPLPA